MYTQGFTVASGTYSALVSRMRIAAEDEVLSVEPDRIVAERAAFFRVLWQLASIEAARFFNCRFHSRMKQPVVLYKAAVAAK
jgi:hypothetical protein